MLSSITAHTEKLICWTLGPIQYCNNTSHSNQNSLSLTDCQAEENEQGRNKAEAPSEAPSVLVVEMKVRMKNDTYYIINYICITEVRYQVSILSTLLASLLVRHLSFN